MSELEYYRHIVAVKRANKAEGIEDPDDQPRQRGYGFFHWCRK